MKNLNLFESRREQEREQEEVTVSKGTNRIRTFAGKVKADVVKEDDVISLFEKLDEVLKVRSKENFSLCEAAEYLRIPEKSVKYYAKRKGELAHVNLKGKLVFKKSDLDEFLAKKIKPGIVKGGLL